MAILTAPWVVPVERPPLKDGRVAVENGRIVWVGPAGEGRQAEGPVVDLGEGILLPGLINAHCHLELSDLRELVAEACRGFVGWVECILEARDRDPTRARARPEVVRALQELEASGTAAVGDVSNHLEHIDLLDSSGLAAAVVFHELLAWDPGAAGEALRDAQQRLATVVGRGLSRTEVRLAAHAPHSVSETLLRALARPAAIHLAESSPEVRFLARGNGDWADFLGRRGLGHVPFTPPGKSPAQYLEGLGVLHPGLVAAHCVHVDSLDRALLRERGVSVAVCPRSNRNLGVGIPPVPEMVAEGIRVCLGTDSLASVPSLDLMEDMAALHREFPDLKPSVIVRMATLEGALALGLPELGSLGPGKRAALAFVPATGVLPDPLAFLVSGQARAHAVRA